MSGRCAEEAQTLAHFIAGIAQVLRQGVFAFASTSQAQKLRSNGSRGVVHIPHFTPEVVRRSETL